MKLHSNFRNSLVLLVSLGVGLGNSPLRAAPDVSHTAGPSQQIEQKIHDVELDSRGTLKGQVLDSQGEPLGESLVQLRHSGEVVAETSTNIEGFFSITGLRGGTYELNAGPGSQVVRAWAVNTAPPQAHELARVVADESIVRGQFAGMEMLTVTALLLAGAGVALGVIAVTDDDNDDSRPASP